MKDWWEHLVQVGVADPAPHLQLVIYTNLEHLEERRRRVFDDKAQLRPIELQ
jgi:hypothetical protein